MNGPLDGLRILDLTTMASGPLATAILGDQGADVIKVEGPTRIDGLRNIGPRRGGMSGLFSTLNRNKRGLAIDLADPRGVEIALELADRADVFIQNFRPGAIDRMGLGYDRLRERNPDLVYVSVSGFGEIGPMAARPVYDSVMQAYAGYARHQADLDSGKPTFIRNVVCDKGTAIQVAQLVTAALLARERGHGGQHLRVSMLHACLAFLWPDGMQNHTLLGPGVEGQLSAAALPMVRSTRDDFITISFIQDREFQALCKILDRPELAEDARFATAGPRAADGEALQELLDPSLRQWSTEDLVAALEAADVPHAILGDPATIHEDEQVQANGLFLEMDHPTAGRLRQPRPLGDFEGTPTSVRRGAPALGEHNDEILEELGRPAQEIETLRRAGVLA